MKTDKDTKETEICENYVPLTVSIEISLITYNKLQDLINKIEDFSNADEAIKDMIALYCSMNDVRIRTRKINDSKIRRLKTTVLKRMQGLGAYSGRKSLEETPSERLNDEIQYKSAWEESKVIDAAIQYFLKGNIELDLSDSSFESDSVKVYRDTDSVILEPSQVKPGQSSKKCPNCKQIELIPVGNYGVHSCFHCGYLQFIKEEPNERPHPFLSMEEWKDRIKEGAESYWERYNKGKQTYKKCNQKEACATAEIEVKRFFKDFCLHCEGNPKTILEIASWEKWNPYLSRIARQRFDHLTLEQRQFRKKCPKCKCVNLIPIGNYGVHPCSQCEYLMFVEEPKETLRCVKCGRELEEKDAWYGCADDESPFCKECLS